MESLVKKRIKTLNELVCGLFDKTKKQHLNCIEAIKENKKDLLEKIINNEKTINKNYHYIFKQIIYSLAIFNLYAKDLRKLMSLSFIITEIERIADYAHNIAKIYVLAETKFEENLFLNKWELLMERFNKVERLMKNATLPIIKDDLQQDQRFEINQLLSELTKEKKIQHHFGLSKKTYYFFLRFKFLDRTNDRLNNIVEYLLFKKSFTEFQKLSN